MKKLLFLICLSLLSALASSQILTNGHGQLIRANKGLIYSPTVVFMYSQQGASIVQSRIEIRMTAGKQVAIDWGNGNSSIANSSISTAYLSNYINPNKLYLIRISGDLAYVKGFATSTTQISLGNGASFKYFTGLETLRLTGCTATSFNCTSNLSTTLDTLQSNFGANILSGTISQLVNLKWFLVNDAGTITGTFPSSLTYISSGNGGTFSGTFPSGCTYITLVSDPSTLTGTIPSGCTTFHIFSANINMSGSAPNSCTELYLYTAKSTFNTTIPTACTYFYENAPLSTFTGTIPSNIVTFIHYNNSNSTLSGSFPSTCNYIYCIGNNLTITGTLPSICTFVQVSGNSMTLSGSVPTSCTLFIANGNGMTFSGAIPVACTQFTASGNNMWSGSLDISACTSMTSFSRVGINTTAIINPTSTTIWSSYQANVNATKFDLSSLSNIGAQLNIYSNANDTALILPTLNKQFTTIDAHGNALNQSSVDNLLAKLDTWYTSHPPTSNLTINIGSGTNAAPTGGNSNVNIVHLNAIFNAVPKLLSITKN
jgi:hypothetical protein